MPGEPLFDTNAVIAWFGGDREIFRLYKTEDKRLSVVPVGELYYGAQKSRRSSENVRRIEQMLGASILLGIDTDVSRRYGDVKASLRSAGTPIPDNDLWIAATAIEHELKLVSNDRHFNLVPGFEVSSW